LIDLPASRAVSIAPMMDRTDRHFRYLLRLIGPHMLLYTEMVVARAICHGDQARLLEFAAAEHPLALQLGGSEPAVLAAAAVAGAARGYDEINLNIGCPSDRVQSGQFGACLMSNPELLSLFAKGLLHFRNYSILAMPQYHYNWFGMYR